MDVLTQTTLISLFLCIIAVRDRGISRRLIGSLISVPGLHQMVLKIVCKCLWKACIALCTYIVVHLISVRSLLNTCSFNIAISAGWRSARKQPLSYSYQIFIFQACHLPSQPICALNHV